MSMKKYIFPLVALGTIGLTSYFSLLPLNGVSQADISDLYFTAITPASFTFSIWSLIYLSWLYLAVQVLLGNIKSGKSLIQFSCAVALTALWLVPWHFMYIGTSFLVMMLIAGILYYIYEKKRYKKDFQWVLELTLGWIIVASIANLHALLVGYNLYFFPVTFTLLSIIIGVYLNWNFLRKKSSFIPSLVFIWALIGIIFGQDNNATQIVASLSILFLGWSILVKFPFSKKIGKKKK